MPFIKMPGVTGKVYVPEDQPCDRKKHNCKDCFSCLMCSDDRCGLCRHDKTAGKKKKENSATTSSLITEQTNIL